MEKQQYHFDILNLDNGLRVVLHCDRSLPLAHVITRYGVGKRDEARGEREMAHLYEHMMCTSLKEVADAHFLLLQAGAEPTAGAADAGVTADDSIYFTTVPKNNLETILWFEAEKMRAPFGAHSEECFEKQLGVVKNEILTRYRRDPFGRSQELMLEGLYTNPHPYAAKTAGDRADLSHVTFAGLRAFGQKFYHPGNCVLVVAGDIDVEKAKQLVEKHFGGLMPSAPLSRHTLCPSSLVQSKEIVSRGPYPVEQMIMAWPSAPMLSEEVVPYMVLGNVLASRGQGLLTEKLVHKGIALEVHAMQESMELAGHFVVAAPIHPGSSARAAKDATLQALKELATEGPDEKAVERIKAKLAFSWSTQLDRVGGGGGRAFEAARYTALKGSPETINDGLDIFASLTAADVKEAAVKLCAAPSLFLDFQQSAKPRCPKGKAKSEMPPPSDNLPASSLPEPQVHKLENGLTILQVHREQSATVHLALYANIGSAGDGNGKEGLASLSASILACKLSELEAIGAKVADVTSAFSTGVVVSTTIEQAKTVLNQMATVLSNFDVAEEEFKRLQQRTIAPLKRVSRNPMALSEFLFPSILFGEGHPLSHLPVGTAKSLENVSKENLLDFNDKWWKPINMKLVAAGPLAIDALRDLAQPAFSELDGGEKQKLVELPKSDLSNKLFGYHLPNVPQTMIMAGGSMPAPLSEDYEASIVAHHILCGAFGSRINLRLREELGYTYGVRTALFKQREGSYWVCFCAVEKGKTKEAMEEMKELFALQGSKGPLTHEEVENAKRSLPINSLVRLQSTESLGRTFGQFSTLELPLERWPQYVNAGANTTYAEVERLALEQFHPSKLTFVLIGDLDDLDMDGIERVTYPF